MSSTPNFEAGWLIAVPLTQSYQLHSATGGIISYDKLMIAEGKNSIACSIIVRIIYSVDQLVIRAKPKLKPGGRQNLPHLCLTRCSWQPQATILYLVPDKTRPERQMLVNFLEQCTTKE